MLLFFSVLNFLSVEITKSTLTSKFARKIVFGIQYSCMAQDKIIRHWLSSAEESALIAGESFSNKHYEWSFFLWALAIEKLLKGLIVKKGDIPLPTHSLQKLSIAAGISLSHDQKRQLDEITTYCIDARYDDYKKDFYKKVTEKIYRETWSTLCKEIIIWLKKMY